LLSIVVHSNGYNPVNILDNDGTVIGAVLIVWLKNVPLCISLSRLGVDDEFNFPIHLSCLNESITRKNIFDFIFMMKHFEALIR
jgi:hypothetical protein